jgi:DNA-binding HxlR family transcriptional regulator
MTRLFTLLGKKWSIFIMYAIGNGCHTFTTIRRHIGDANTKILTDRLAELVAEGVITKDEHGDYTLSPKGQELEKKIKKLGEWWGTCEK